MKGAMPEALAKINRRPKSKSIDTIGINHQRLRAQRKVIISPSTPKLVTMLRKKFLMVSISPLDKFRLPMVTQNFHLDGLGPLWPFHCRGQFLEHASRVIKSHHTRLPVHKSQLLATASVVPEY